MTSRHIRVLVPPPVPVPRAADWIGQFLDWVHAARSLRAASPSAPRTLPVPQCAAEGGK